MTFSEILNECKSLLADGNTESAIILLTTLINKVEDDGHKTIITSILGDLFFKERRYFEARKYYEKLPFDENNFSKFILTYIETKDINGLFIVEEEFAEYLKDITLNSILQKGISIVIENHAVKSEIKDIHRSIYEKNLKSLKKIEPSIYEEISLIGFPENFYQRLLYLNEYLYYKFQDQWYRTGLKDIENGLNINELKKAIELDKSIIVNFDRPDRLWQYIKVNQTENPKFLKKVNYIVIDFDMFNDCLTSIDFSPLIECDYVFRIIDYKHFEEQYTKIILYQDVIAPEMYMIFDDNREFIELKVDPINIKLISQIKERMELYRQNIAKRYHSDFLKDFYIKHTNKNLKIMFLTSKYTTFLQYCTRDLAEAFDQIGCKTFILKEGDNDPFRSRVDLLYKSIDEWKPDIVLCVDHLRYEFNLPQVIPFVTWIQDVMVKIFDIEDKDLIGDQNYIYSISIVWQKQLSEKKAYKNKKIGLLPHLLDPSIYFPINCSKRYDVTYVAHLQLPDQYIKALSDLPDSALDEDELNHRLLINYLNTFSLHDLAEYFIGQDEVRKKLLRNFSLDLSQPTSELNKNNRDYIRDQIIATMLRLKPIEYLIEHGITVMLFGKSWEKHPKLKKFAMGPVNNGHDLNHLINETKINLNLSPGMTFHNKVPEVAGSASFFISRNMGEHDLMPIDYFFEKDTEVVLFNDEKDLLNKVSYFLEHEEERNAIARRAYEKIIKNFTFVAGAKQILNDIIG